jgi:hypothetical protein
MFASTEKVDLPHIENAFHARHPSTAAPTSDDSLYLREVVMQLVIICLFSYYGRRHFGRDLHPQRWHEMCRPFQMFHWSAAPGIG